MSTQVHPTAIVSPEVVLGENVYVGPYSVLTGKITIGENSKLKSHVVMEGNLEIGKNNEFFQFCSIGMAPQDLSYKDEDTKVVIGDNNVFRESVTVHRATTKENYLTTIGSNCLFMAYSHVAHDCIIGNNAILINTVNLAGHVKVGDRAIIGGGTNISPFVTIGKGAYLGGATGADRDIPPFCTAYGNRAKLKGVNIIGMRRHGYERQIISDVVEFYRTMESSAFSPKSFVENKEHIEIYIDNPVVQEIAKSIEVSKVGIAPFMQS